MHQGLGWKEEIPGLATGREVGKESVLGDKELEQIESELSFYEEGSEGLRGLIHQAPREFETLQTAIRDAEADRLIEEAGTDGDAEAIKAHRKGLEARTRALRPLEDQMRKIASKLDKATVERAEKDLRELIDVLNKIAPILRGEELPPEEGE